MNFTVGSDPISHTIRLSLYPNITGIEISETIRITISAFCGRALLLAVRRRRPSLSSRPMMRSGWRAGSLPTTMSLLLKICWGWWALGSPAGLREDGSCGVVESRCAEVAKKPCQRLHESRF